MSSIFLSGVGLLMMTLSKCQSGSLQGLLHVALFSLHHHFSPPPPLPPWLCSSLHPPERRSETVRRTETPPPPPPPVVPPRVKRFTPVSVSGAHGRIRGEREDKRAGRGGFDPHLLRSDEVHSRGRGGRWRAGAGADFSPNS